MNIPIVTKKTIKVYTPQCKLEVIELCEKLNNLHEVERITNISRSCLRDWLKKKHQITQISATKTRKRLFGAGRKPLLPELEKDLNNWVDDQFDKKLVVTREVLKERALLIANQHLSNAPQRRPFEASERWCSNFLRRFHKTACKNTQQINMTTTIDNICAESV